MNLISQNNESSLTMTRLNVNGLKKIKTNLQKAQDTQKEYATFLYSNICQYVDFLSTCGW